MLAFGPGAAACAGAPKTAARAQPTGGPDADEDGNQDDDGCPDTLPVETKDVVTVTKEELKCCAKILFPTGKSTIDAASQPVLEHIAKTLKDNPKIDILEVAGHAD